MKRAVAVAAALLAHAAAAQEVPRDDLRYTPNPVWFRGDATVLPDGRGRMRVVTAPQGAAALTLNQYDAYERLHRAALARLSFRMPVERADALAREEALAAILARYPATRVAALPVAPIAAPDLPVRPVR